MEHKHIPKESLEVFTIENVKQGSEWYVLKYIWLVYCQSRLLYEMNFIWKNCLEEFLILSSKKCVDDLSLEMLNFATLCTYKSLYFTCLQ